MSKIQDLFTQLSESNKVEFPSFSVKSPHYPIGVVDGWTISSHGFALKEGNEGNVEVKHIHGLWRKENIPQNLRLMGLGDETLSQLASLSECELGIDDFINDCYCYSQGKCLNLGNKIVCISYDDNGDICYTEVNTNTFEYFECDQTGQFGQIEILSCEPGLEDILDKWNEMFEENVPELKNLEYIGDSTVFLEMIDSGGILFKAALKVVTSPEPDYTIKRDNLCAILPSVLVTEDLIDNPDVEVIKSDTHTPYFHLVHAEIA